MSIGAALLPLELLAAAQATTGLRTLATSHIDVVGRVVAERSASGLLQRQRCGRFSTGQSRSASLRCLRCPRCLAAAATPVFGTPTAIGALAALGALARLALAAALGTLASVRGDAQGYA